MRTGPLLSLLRDAFDKPPRETAEWQTNCSLVHGGTFRLESSCICTVLTTAKCCIVTDCILPEQHPTQLPKTSRRARLLLFLSRLFASMTARVFPRRIPRCASRRKWWSLVVRGCLEPHSKLHSTVCRVFSMVREVPPEPDHVPRTELVRLGRRVCT